MRGSVHRMRAFSRLLAPGLQLPVYVTLFATHRCDARCGHCFMWRELNQPVNELTVEEVDAVAASIGPVLQVTLTGGSPELREDLPDLVHAFHTRCRPLNLTICVNGYHTERIAEQTAEMLRRCPGQRVTIGISLDGIGEDHDRVRQMPGLFDNVLRTIDRLKALKRRHDSLILAVAVTVSELNHETAAATARWARENLAVDMVKPILVRGQPRLKRARGEHAVDAYRRLVDDDRMHLRTRRSSPASVTEFMISVKEDVQRSIIAGFDADSPGGLPCSAMRQNLVIKADGAVAGCELRDEIMGNVRDFSYDIKKLWKSCASHAFRREIRQQQCRCYHHCFLAPALIRQPIAWPQVLRSAWKSHALLLANRRLAKD